MRARVSIGMPLFNAERYLEATLESILSQTFTDFELIISDNASTDGTEDICRRHAASDARISYSRNQRNMGASYNYNRTFELSSGEYFRHNAYDDTLAPTYLARCVEVLDDEPEVVLTYPHVQFVDEHGEPHPEDAFQGCDLNLRMKTPHERLRAYIPRGGPNSMCDPVFGLFRSSALRKTPVLGNFISADAILLAEIALHGEIAVIPEVLFYERFHPGGSVLSNPTLDDRYAWFDPANRGRISNQLPHWRWFLELLKAINRTTLDPLEKARCYAVMPYWLWWTKRGLLTDLAHTARYVSTAIRSGRDVPRAN
jgi:glycosyltransferase involved in cell wall biosynthesis